MQYFIYVYKEEDRKILESMGLPMLHGKEDQWGKSVPYTFLVNGVAGAGDTERIMSRLSESAVLTNQLFFDGSLGSRMRSARRPTHTQEVMP